MNVCALVCRSLEGQRHQNPLELEETVSVLVRVSLTVKRQQVL